MTVILLVECAALLLLLGGSAFFSSAETALFTINAIQIHRLRRSRPRRAALIDRLRATPMRLLSTILIGNTFVNIIAAALGYMIGEGLKPGYGEMIAIPSMTILLLVFGEVTPKRLAMAHPVRIAAGYAPVLNVLVPMLSPVRRIVEWLTAGLKRRLTAERQTLTEDEFRTVIEVSEEVGALDREERTMVDGIIRLEDTQASDVMTPRVDLIGIDLDDTRAEQQRIARSVTFRYLPVFRGTPDQPLGFLDVPRFLLARDAEIESALIPPYFVPETAPLDALLTSFQRDHRRVAFVADEFGGTAGLLTRGDILEEIVTDVDNEYGPRKYQIQQVGEKNWLIDGSTSLEDINYELGTRLDSEGADRIAGWVSAVAEHIPRSGETVEAQGCRVTAMRVRRQRVLTVLLEKLPPLREPQPGEDGQ